MGWEKGRNGLDTAGEPYTVDNAYYLVIRSVVIEINDIMVPIKR